MATRPGNSKWTGYSSSAKENVAVDMGKGSWGHYGMDQDASVDTNATGDPSYIVGTSGADRDVNRYRALGSETRAPITLDQRRADRARGLQVGALGMLETAAKGDAPSAAAIQGRLAADQINTSNMRALGGARGIGGAVASANAVSPAMGNQLVGSLSNVAQARANEAAQDRTAFAGTSAGVRGQDIGAATTNAELAAKSQALDEARQQGMERLGWNTRNAQLQGNAEYWRQFEERIAAAKRAGEEDKANKIAGAKTAAGIGLGALLAFSDVRTKTNTYPVGKR